MQHDTMELEDINQPTRRTASITLDLHDPTTVQELHPIDRGGKAWLYLAGAFIIDFFYWGFIISFGIFQNYLTSHQTLEGNGSSIIGQVGTGILYLTSPFVIRYINRFPKHRTAMMHIGTVICCISCLIASSQRRLLRQIWHLILTQGVTYGLGTSIMFFPAFSYLNEWFVRRRGLANGVLFGGSAAGGVILSFFLEWTLTSFGYRVTLRIWAVILAIISVPVISLLLKGRLPVSQMVAATRINLSFFKSPLFIFLSLSNLLQGLAYFIPGIYLPSYASDISMTSVQSTLVLSLFNLASLIGQTTTGHLSDRFGSGLPLYWSTAGGTLSVALLWGLSKSFVPLVIFSLLYGLSAGGYSVLWSRFTMDVADDPIMQSTIYGVFMFQRGIGNVASGPISAVLVGSRKYLASYAVGKYETVVLFTGITMAISSLVALGRLKFYVPQH